MQIGTIIISLNGALNINREVIRKDKNDITLFKLTKQECVSFLTNQQGEKYCLSGNIPSHQRTAEAIRSECTIEIPVTEDQYYWWTVPQRSGGSYVQNLPSKSSLRQCGFENTAMWYSPNTSEHVRAMPHIVDIVHDYLVNQQLSTADIFTKFKFILN